MARIVPVMQRNRFSFAFTYRYFRSSGEATGVLNA